MLSDPPAFSSLARRPHRPLFEMVEPEMQVNWAFSYFVKVNDPGGSQRCSELLWLETNVCSCQPVTLEIVTGQSNLSGSILEIDMRSRWLCSKDNPNNNNPKPKQICEIIWEILKFLGQNKKKKMKYHHLCDVPEAMLIRLYSITRRPVHEIQAWVGN